MSQETNMNNEIEDMKHIWGIKSYDDLTGSKEATLWTMNDFDITYFEDEKKYILNVETIYEFVEENGKRQYIGRIFSNFTAWMLDNGFDTNYKLSIDELFTTGLNINTHFDSIEQAYALFKLLASAYENS